MYHQWSVTEWPIVIKWSLDELWFVSSVGKIDYWERARECCNSWRTWGNTPMNDYTANVKRQVGRTRCQRDKHHFHPTVQAWERLVGPVMLRECHERTQALPCLFTQSRQIFTLRRSSLGIITKFGWPAHQARKRPGNSHFVRFDYFRGIVSSPRGRVCQIL